MTSTQTVDSDTHNVLDHGYVKLIDTLGSDVSIVNAARVSYDKSVDEMGPKDEGLLNFLLREGHTSPLRHAALTFEAFAPLMVARQWWKYVIGSSHTQDSFLAWNESSRRYITEDEVFYVPDSDEWRTAPENSKQGSGPPLPPGHGAGLHLSLMDYVKRGLELYERALSLNVAPEQARLFLPAYGMYVRWRWTASLGGVIHFLEQRLESDAQYEIQLYAKAVEQLTANAFPMTYKAWRTPR